MSTSTMTITPPLGRLDEKCTSLGSHLLANARRMFKMGRGSGAEMETIISGSIISAWWKKLCSYHNVLYEIENKLYVTICVGFFSVKYRRKRALKLKLDHICTMSFLLHWHCFRDCVRKISEEKPNDGCPCSCLFNEKRFFSVLVPYLWPYYLPQWHLLTNSIGI